MAGYNNFARISEINTVDYNQPAVVLRKYNCNIPLQTIAQVNNDLEQVMNKLGSASVEKTESRRQQRRNELVEKLKSLYPGVYGRLMKLCEPVHKRYNVAITKVLGRNMEAIVVETEKVARQCMGYMKEQRCEPETFLPLDYIDAKPINDRLREITEPKGVK